MYHLGPHAAAGVVTGTAGAAGPFLSSGEVLLVLLLVLAILL
jgi:hypothetical protein